MPSLWPVRPYANVLSDQGATDASERVTTERKGRKVRSRKGYPGKRGTARTKELGKGLSRDALRVVVITMQWNDPREVRIIVQDRESIG